MSIDLLYFAWVREAIGADGERVDPPAEVATVDDLLDWLGARSDAHARAFADRRRLRAALDQQFVGMDAGIAGARLGNSRELVRAALGKPIKIRSLNFMRGRTFLNRFIILDEAQNLTPKQMKALITRAGPGTKIACLGNIAQIDTPYLTEGFSGLTYVVDRMKDWSHAGHVTLARGERSRLADHAAEVL